MGLISTALGGIFIIGTLVVAAAAYLNDRESRNGKGRSLALYLAGILAAGALCSVVAVPVFFLLCSGKTCAWIATLVVFPGSIALGVGVFIRMWMRRGRAPEW